ncbi:hypothetical protein HOK68_02080 [Candidatus Woesearchaeota archaeon]|jgi:hypothetical protein|nr:hypothetical protein [Candidatus Woesearchaeota archaeon]MBT4387900.1 hypothetical protein [Candidatus Woesearchaeota archaeon]MBT4595718.1 hypothetical protein [Candidatus Woesearchaeota archaeon]MBT5741433.1 hypothetical protein [Candidatus Woesearchaeota archaeon]MBT6505543.1 hypothetical protein [Candidatus Woesearchaeota archaeon]
METVSLEGEIKLEFIRRLNFANPKLPLSIEHKKNSYVLKKIGDKTKSSPRYIKKAKGCLEKHSPNFVAFLEFDYQKYYFQRCNPGFQTLRENLKEGYFIPEDAIDLVQNLTNVLFNLYKSEKLINTNINLDNILIQKEDEDSEYLVIDNLEHFTSKHSKLEPISCEDYDGAFQAPELMEGIWSDKSMTYSLCSILKNMIDPDILKQDTKTGNILTNLLYYGTNENPYRRLSLEEFSQDLDHLSNEDSSFILNSYLAKRKHFNEIFDTKMSEVPVLDVAKYYVKFGFKMLSCDFLKGLGNNFLTGLKNGLKFPFNLGSIFKEDENKNPFYFPKTMFGSKIIGGILGLSPYGVGGYYFYKNHNFFTYESIGMWSLIVGTNLFYSMHRNHLKGVLENKINQELESEKDLHLSKNSFKNVLDFDKK